MEGASHPGSGKIGYIDQQFTFLQVLPESGGALPNIQILRKFAMYYKQAMVEL